MRCVVDCRNHAPVSGCYPEHLTLMSEDYYSVLNVPKLATKEDIQKSYRSLARKFHPDVNPDDPDAKKKFQRLQEAFDVLGNDEKRKMYDQFGSASTGQGMPGGGAGPQGKPFYWNPQQGSPFPGNGRGSKTGNEGSGFNIDDILEMFSSHQPQSGFTGRSGTAGGPFQQFFDMGMGGAGSVPRPEKGRRRSTGTSSQEGATGSDILQSITVPFVQSVTGGKASISIQRSKSSKSETISFVIPAGVEDGKKIRLRGLGNPSASGGRSGNLIIQIQVEPHPYFQRVGRNLILTVPITLKEAVFGAKIDIPSPKGQVSLSIPPGSTSGMKLRAKGCGVPVSSVSEDTSSPHNVSDAGDLIAELKIVLPRNWSEQDLELLQKLEAKEQIGVRHQLRWS